MSTDLDGFDFNLLKTLNCLLAERHVSRAAEALGRSQPAVSNALQRLRTALDDELLVRSPKGFVLTPRAEALQGPLRELIGLVESSVLPAGRFNPANATDVLRIGMPDRLTIAVVPPLLARLQKHAPKMRLHVTTTDRDQALQSINDDGVDLVIGWVHDMPPHVESELLLEEAPFCVMRPGHPLLKRRGRFDMDAMLSYPHVVVSAISTRMQIFDDLLAQHGFQRTARVTLTNFTAVPHLLEHSDMIGVFTQLAADVFVKSFGLAKRPVPLDVGNIASKMIWHSRYTRDQKHLWLRQQVKAVYATLS